MLDDETINIVSVETTLKLLLVTIVTFVSEIEDYYSVTKDIENEIKKRIKYMQEQLYLIQTIIDNEVLKQDKSNTNIDKFKHLVEKPVEDGLRYIITSIVKIQIQLDLDTLTDKTTDRVKQVLKSVNKYFRKIDKLYYNE